MLSGRCHKFKKENRMKSKILFLLIFAVVIFPFFGKVFAQDEYDWDFTNYTIPAPIVDAQLIGEDKDVYAVRVFWNMPESDEGDAYGFVVEKEGPQGRKQAAVYYPPSLGFDDIINSGFYFDEAVLEGDTYNYYVKAYDRSGKESDWGKASVSIPLESKFEIELTSIQQTSGLTFNWWTKEFSTVENKYVDVNTYSYLELDSKRYDGSYGSRHSVQLDESALSSLRTGGTYQYRIKAYPKQDNENIGFKEITGPVTYNPCGISVFSKSADSIMFSIDKTSGTVDLVFNGQAMTKTISRHYYFNFDYFIVSGLEPFTVYDYQVQGCGGMRQASTGLVFSEVKTTPAAYSAVVTWKTSVSSSGSVVVDGIGTFDGGGGTEHSAAITGLKPVTSYNVTIIADGGTGLHDTSGISIRTTPSVEVNGGLCGIHWEEVLSGEKDPYGNPLYEKRISFSTNYPVSGGLYSYCSSLSVPSQSFEGTNFNITDSGRMSCSNPCLSSQYPFFGVKFCRTDTDDPNDCRSYNLWQWPNSPCKVKEQCNALQPSSSSSEPASASFETTMIKQDAIKQNDQAGAILFETTEPTTTVVEYGTTGGKYTQTQAIESAGTTLKIHPVKLENLKSRTYHYRIVAKDKAGKEYFSEDRVLKHGNWFFRFWGDLWGRSKGLFQK